MLLSRAVKAGQGKPGGSPAVGMASSAAVPSSPAQGGSKSMDMDQIKSIAAMLRGSFGGKDMKESLWNGTPEEVGERHHKFLCLWFRQPPTSIEVTRKIWQEAFPGLDKASRNSVLKKLAAVKSMCNRKDRNSKTGELMASWLKELLQALKEPASARPVRRLSTTGTDSQPEVAAVPEVAPAAVAAATPPKRRILRKEPSIGSVAASVPSSAELVESSSVASTPVQSLGQPEKKNKAKAKGKAKAKAKAKAQSCKRPAGLHKANPWKESKSFGLVKPTFAKDKSYIVFKKDKASKERSLVNCQGLGDHAAIVRQLMEWVCQEEAGLTKEDVIAKREKIRVAFLAAEAQPVQG